MYKYILLFIITVVSIGFTSTTLAAKCPDGYKQGAVDIKTNKRFCESARNKKCPAFHYKTGASGYDCKKSGLRSVCPSGSNSCSFNGYPHFCCVSFN